MALYHLSLLITSLVDMEARLAAPLGALAQRLMTCVPRVAQSTSACRLPVELLSKLHLLDLPFAKTSVSSRLAEMLDVDDEKNTAAVAAASMRAYFDLFVRLVEQQIGHMADSFARLTQILAINITSSSSDVDAALDSLNFHLDIVIKYVAVYLDLLVAGDTKLNTSEQTAVFHSRLAASLTSVLDMFTLLKGELTSAAAHMRSSCGPYLFFFEFSSADCRWPTLVMLDKLNAFLSLFFVDFRLVNSREPQQLSQHLLDKHWDFAFCYAASVLANMKKQQRRTLNTVRVQTMSVGFLTMLHALVKCMHGAARDNTSGTYAATIYADWTGFFAGELFAPLLVLFVKQIDESASTSKQLQLYYDNLRTTCTQRTICATLGELVTLMSYEQLVLAAASLEPKLNILDVATTGGGALLLSDPLHTLVNHLVAGLTSRLASLQLASYKLLRSLMRRMFAFYQTPPSASDQEQEATITTAAVRIVDSLPHALRDTFARLTDLFANLSESNIPFDQNILVVSSSSETENNDNDNDNDSDNSDDMLQVDTMRHEANNKLMAYMLVSRLMLDMFAGDEAGSNGGGQLEFKVRLASDLRQLKFSEHLVNCLFHVMPAMQQSSSRHFVSPAGSNGDEASDQLTYCQLARFDSFDNKHVRAFACHLYKYALKLVPALIRDWWNIQPKRVADVVDKYTSKYVSPTLLDDEIRQINRSVNEQQQQQPPAAVQQTNASKSPPPKKYVEDDDEESIIRIRGVLSSREVVAVYKMKELTMELVVQLPGNYPLGVVQVSSVKRLGVSENEWRNWLLQLTTFLTHQNGSIIQGLHIWQRNVDKKFAGVEECTICYSVIHGTNYTLPKMACRTCKKLFHNICLYKWFESSSKSTCPLCRNLF